MNVSEYDYELPARLIAQFPPAERTSSRLLVVGEKQPFEDRSFEHIVDYFESGDLLVLNNTKVIPARLFGKKDTGGKVEILLERILDEVRILAQIKASRAPKVGQELSVEGDESTTLRVVSRQRSFFELEIHGTNDLIDWFNHVGHMPLPPYIDRADVDEDTCRYQTVFAERDGAVAAPTAGLHYDQSLLAKIKEKGVQICHLTLHVGAGTYQPVRVDSIEDHQMHSEYIEVSQALCDAVHLTKANGGRVIAVGTTVVRALESAALRHESTTSTDILQAYSGDTDIFIFPGFEFKVVDLMQTNFHLPQSTLLMLVSAFAGRQTIRDAYQHAIDQQYRFFSYGDAMLLQLKR